MNRLKIVGVLVAIVVAAIYWYGAQQIPPVPQAVSAMPVRIAAVEEGVITDKLEALSTAKAVDAVDITARVTAIVESIHFEDNQAAMAGDLLVELESANERAALNEARVNLAEETRLLNHYRTLVKTNAISKTLLAEQKSRVAAAQTRVEAAAAKLANYSVRAPFSGVLGFRQTSPGALVEPGTRITTLDAIDPLRLEFTAPEQWVGKIDVGEKIMATSVAYPGRKFTAEIITVGERLDPNTRAVTVQAHMENADRAIKPGMSLYLVLTSRERRALLIPEEALVLEGSGKFVYRLSADRRVERQPVTIGVRSAGKIEILAGLEKGEQVVREGTQKVRQGDFVSVLVEDSVGR